MKIWSILFTAAAAAALTATLLGQYHQIIMFVIAACMAYICWYTHYQETRFSKPRKNQPK